MLLSSLSFCSPIPVFYFYISAMNDSIDLRPIPRPLRINIKRRQSEIVCKIQHRKSEIFIHGLAMTALINVITVLVSLSPASPSYRVSLPRHARLRRRQPQIDRVSTSRPWLLSTNSSRHLAKRLSSLTLTQYVEYFCPNSTIPCVLMCVGLS